MNAGPSWLSGRLNASYNDNPLYTIALQENFDGFIHNWDRDINFSPFHSLIHGIDDQLTVDDDNIKYWTEIQGWQWWKDWDATIECARDLFDELESMFVSADNNFHYLENDLSLRALFGLCDWKKPNTESTFDFNSNSSYIANSSDNIDQIMRSLVEWYVMDFEYGKPMETLSVDSVFEDILEISGWLYNGSFKEFFVTDCRGTQGILLHIASQFLDYKTVNNNNNGTDADDPSCPNMIYIDDTMGNNENILHLNEYVWKIEYYDNGCRVFTEGGHEDSSGEYTAKYVILTAGLTPLTLNRIEIYPQVPFWKDFAWNEYSMVQYQPIYVVFPFDFW